MKTWLNKETGKWQSEVPEIFWTGYYDNKGNKIYSDENWRHKAIIYEDFELDWEYEKPINGKTYKELKGTYPFFDLGCLYINHSKIIIEKL